MMTFQNKLLLTERYLYYLDVLQDERRIPGMYFTYIPDYWKELQKLLRMMI